MKHADLNHMRMRNPTPCLPALHASYVSAGDWLVADGGHMCMQAGRTFRVHSAARRGLVINCDHGRHYLRHSQTPAGYLIGLTRKETS